MGWREVEELQREFCLTSITCLFYKGCTNPAPIGLLVKSLGLHLSPVKDKMPWECLSSINNWKSEKIHKTMVCPSIAVSWWHWLFKCPAQSCAQNETKNYCFELPRRTLNARCFYYYQLLRETVITKWKRLAHVWLRTTSLPIWWPPRILIIVFKRDMMCRMK